MIVQRSALFRVLLDCKTLNYEPSNHQSGVLIEHKETMDVASIVRLFKIFNVGISG